MLAGKRRPPDSVVFVARTHWFTGVVILASVGLLHVIALTSPVLAFGAKAYAIALALGAFYIVAGTSVWLGWPVGRTLHSIGTALFLPRPALGRQLWQIGRSEEFKAHFAPQPDPDEAPQP